MLLSMSGSLRKQAVLFQQLYFYGLISIRFDCYFISQGRSAFVFFFFSSKNQLLVEEIKLTDSIQVI